MDRTQTKGYEMSVKLSLLVFLVHLILNMLFKNKKHVKFLGHMASNNYAQNTRFGTNTSKVSVKFC